MPGADALARELAALIPALAQGRRDAAARRRLPRPAEGECGEDRARPPDRRVPGDDPAAVLQRIEARAAQGDLAGALAELAKLPAPARALAKAWIAKVEARNAAVEASRRFAADALAALGKPSL